MGRCGWNCGQALCDPLSLTFIYLSGGLHWRLSDKETLCQSWVQSLGHEVPLEKEMATQSSILAWEIPWTEEPGQRVGHN